MKRNFDHQNKLVLQVRTESGTAAIDIGLEWLTRQERKFLHNLIKNTREGGTVGFGVDPGAEGESVIKLSLKQKLKAEDSNVQAS